MNAIDRVAAEDEESPSVAGGGDDARTSQIKQRARHSPAEFSSSPPSPLCSYTLRRTRVPLGHASRSRYVSLHARRSTAHLPRNFQLAQRSAEASSGLGRPCSLPTAPRRAPRCSGGSSLPKRLLWYVFAFVNHQCCCAATFGCHQLVRWHHVSDIPVPRAYTVALESLNTVFKLAERCLHLQSQSMQSRLLTERSCALRRSRQFYRRAGVARRFSCTKQAETPHALAVWSDAGYMRSFEGDYWTGSPSLLWTLLPASLPRTLLLQHWQPHLPCSYTWSLDSPTVALQVKMAAIPAGARWRHARDDRGQRRAVLLRAKGSQPGPAAAA